MGILDAFSSMLDFGYRPRLQEQRKAALDQMIQESSAPMQGAKPMSEILQAYGELNPGVWGDAAFQNMHRAALQNESNMNAQSKADEAARLAAEASAYDQSVAKELQPLEGAAYERALANYSAQAPVGSRYYGKAADLVKAPGDTEIKQAETTLAYIRSQDATKQAENRAEGRKRADEQRIAAAPAQALNPQQRLEYGASLAKLDSAAQVSKDVMHALDNFGTGAKALDRGTVNAMQAAYKQRVIPAMAAMVGTGTLQKGDMDFIESVIGNPGAWTSLDSRQRAKVANIFQSIDDERKRLYSADAKKAPEIQVGQSSWSRSRTPIQPQGATRPWTPGAKGGASGNY
jgi:hypothetical protein